MKNITFRQFINTFNFRYLREKDNSGCELIKDSETLRIHHNSLDYGDWFEFGIYDFDSFKMKRVESIFSKDILDSYVNQIEFVSDNSEQIEIWLTDDEETD